ncbi:hypothetical protein P1P68_30735 [Streptomyces scabiei]|uniref:hypothetical protein n=1 Tax=Streptomyces scabiei TaxID=1930 RepID=UPI00298F84F3|nr:hypothetical protein [Streptomyces scabiei]MDW8809057.1 hypothetical protein [Streptomyces scabiei]
MLAAMAWLLLPTATEPAERQPTGRHADEAPAAGGHPAARDRDEPSGSSVRGVTTVGHGPPVRPAGPARSAASQGTDERPVSQDDAAPVDEGTSGTDLILPVAAAGAAVAVAAYSLVRRRRRARAGTTPAGVFEPPADALPDLHHRALRLVVETDDSVRTSAEELRFAAARPGRAAAEPSSDGPGDQGTDAPASPAEESEPRPHPEAGPPQQPDEEQRPATDPEPSDAEPAAASPKPSDAEPAAAGPEASDAEPAAAAPHPHGPAADGSPQPRSEPRIVLDPAMAFAETPAGRDAVQPFVEALADARRELLGACRAGLRLEEERGALPPDEERALVEEILTRCTTAQRRLDTATPAFDQLRALEWDITPALECAEARFRELAARTAAAATTLTELREAYVPAASLPVTGHVEQAKDRLVFATTELNRARQAAYPGDLRIAAVHLRAAEGAIDQADLFVTGVERLAAELAHAAVTAAQGARSGGPYDDPFDVLRGQGHWFLPAHSAVAAAADFITTHRAAVGAPARIRLSEAERQLTGVAPKDPAGPEEADDDAEDARRAHALAQEARRLAEQDVRAYGNPYGGAGGDGLAGALLGGIVLGEPSDESGRTEPKGPACYGGTATRARRAEDGLF